MLLKSLTMSPRCHPRIQPFIWKHDRVDIMRRLSPEVVNAILELLAPPDQICFSLSSKFLYSHFLVVLLAENKWPFQLCPFKRRPVMSRNIDTETQPRTHLLRQLENRRWRYCSECWKLHRRSAWHYPLSRKQRLFLKPFCMPYAGKVELCPCLTISFPGMDHLIGTIKIAKQGYARTYYYDGLLENVDRVCGILRHDCTFQDHPAANVRINTTFDWDYESQMLIVMSGYQFELELESFSQRCLRFTGIKTPLFCSRKNTQTWLRRFFDEAGSSFSGWHKSCLDDASLSHNDIKGLKTVQSENGRILTITVKRKLGSGKWSDITWLLNSVVRL